MSRTTRGAVRKTGDVDAGRQVLKTLRGKRMQAAEQSSRKLVLEFAKQPMMASLIRDMACGWRPMVPDETRGGELIGAMHELLAVGARGDGKTIGAYAGMLAHAAEHQARGFPLPVTWMGIMDTYRSHELKTIPSLQEPLWQGAWTLSGDGRVARAWTEGRRRILVEVHLFGVEDQGAMDKMRMAAHCLHVDEAAPTAVMVLSNGISETSWLLGLTSLRMPTHAHLALITENYPDEDHWTWQRFQLAHAVGRRLYRIPPGERASAVQRAQWQEALKDRPDLLKRLLAGQPGGVMLGPQVAAGFDQDLHVAKGRLRPVPNEPLAVGVDFGHTPTLILGNSARGEIRPLAAFSVERGGIKQLVEQYVQPWLATHAPWVLRDPDLLVGEYDPAGETAEETDIEQNPAQTLETLLPGRWSPGPVAWEARKGRLIGALNAHVGPGKCALQIDPVEARPLVQALNGRWHYPQKASGQLSRDLPKKPNHPWEDYGDAFIYFLGALSGAIQPRSTAITVETMHPLLMGARP